MLVLGSSMNKHRSIMISVHNLRKENLTSRIKVICKCGDLVKILNIHYPSL